MSMPEIQIIRPYYFTDDEINFILRLIRNNAEFEDDEEDQKYMESLARDIASQISKP